MKKKILAIAVAVCVMVAMMPCMSFATSSNVTTELEFKNAIGYDEMVFINGDITLTEDYDLTALTTKTIVYVSNKHTLTIAAGKKFTGHITVLSGGKLVVKNGAVVESGQYYAMFHNEYDNIVIGEGGVADLQGGSIVTAPKTSYEMCSGKVVNNGTIKNTSSKYAGNVYIGCNENGLRYEGSKVTSTSKYKVNTKVFVDDSSSVADVKKTAKAKFGSDYTFAGALFLDYARDMITSPKPITKPGKLSSSAIASMKVQYNGGKVVAPKVTITGIPSSAYKVSSFCWDEYGVSNKKVGMGAYNIEQTTGKIYRGAINTAGFFLIVAKTPVISKVTAGKKKITVTMKTTAKANGGSKYIVKYKQVGTSTWKTKTTTSKTVTISKLKKGKKYQVKVQAYAAVPSKQKDTCKAYGISNFSSDYSKTKTSAKVK